MKFRCSAVRWVRTWRNKTREWVLEPLPLNLRESQLRLRPKIVLLTTSTTKTQTDLGICAAKFRFPTSYLVAILMAPALVPETMASVSDHLLKVLLSVLLASLMDLHLVQAPIISPIQKI